jgi:hypothetical protein
MKLTLLHIGHFYPQHVSPHHGEAHPTLRLREVRQVAQPEERNMVPTRP